MSKITKHLMLKVFNIWLYSKCQEKIFFFNYLMFGLISKVTKHFMSKYVIFGLMSEITKHLMSKYEIFGLNPKSQKLLMFGFRSSVREHFCTKTVFLCRKGIWFDLKFQKNHCFRGRGGKFDNSNWLKLLWQAGMKGDQVPLELTVVQQ
jgi:hypothetical protein